MSSLIQPAAAKAAAGKPRKERIFSLDFILIFMLGFLGSSLSNGLNSAVPVLIDSIGGLAVFAGATTTVFSLAAGLGRFFGGNLSDRFGRKKLEIVGSAVMVLGCLISMPASVPAALLVGRGITGLGFAMITTASAAAAADNLPPSRMGEGIGYYGLSLTLSIAFAPALGVALVAWGGGLSLFGGFAGMSALALLLACVCRFRRWRDEHPPVEADSLDAPATITDTTAMSSEPADTQAMRPLQRLLWSLIERTALPVALIQGLLSLATLMFTVFASLYAIRYGLQQITLFYVLMAVSVVVARVACGKLFDIVSRRALMIPAVALTIAALLLLLLAQTEWSLLASGILYGLSGAFAMPVLSAEVVRRAPETRWGAGNAMLWLSMDIGVGFGVLILGAIIDNFGFEAMIGASILILLATTIIVLRVFPAKAR